MILDDLKDKVSTAPSYKKNTKVHEVLKSKCIDLAEEEEGSEEGDQLQEPLLMGLNSDDEGSVGSEDSTDYDTEDESMPPPISKHPSQRVTSLLPDTISNVAIRWYLLSGVLTMPV